VGILRRISGVIIGREKFPPLYQSVRDDEHLWADDDDEDVIYPEVGNSSSLSLRTGGYQYSGAAGRDEAKGLGSRQYGPR